MLTNVHENSIESYHGDYMGSRTLKERIYDYSLRNKRFTTKMVAHGLGVVPSTLSRWIRVLEQEGKLKTELSKHTCMITGNNSMYFYNPDYAQMRLI